MANLWANVSQLGTIFFHLILLVLTCLSIAVATSKARAHLTWLIPMALAWFFLVGGSLCQLAFFALLHSGGYSSNLFRGLQIPLMIMSSGSWLCWIWAGIALLIRMRAIVPEAIASRYPASSAQGLSENEGSWPPPPTI